MAEPSMGGWISFEIPLHAAVRKTFFKQGFIYNRLVQSSFVDYRLFHW